MVKKYNTALQSTGKVLDPVVNNIWVKATKAIKKKDVPISKRSIESLLKFFFCSVLRCGVLYLQLMTSSQELYVLYWTPVLVYLQSLLVYTSE